MVNLNSLKTIFTSNSQLKIISISPSRFQNNIHLSIKVSIIFYSFNVFPKLIWTLFPILSFIYFIDRLLIKTYLHEFLFDKIHEWFLQSICKSFKEATSKMNTKPQLSSRTCRKGYPKDFSQTPAIHQDKSLSPVTPRMNSKLQQSSRTCPKLRRPFRTCTKPSETLKDVSQTPAIHQDKSLPSVTLKDVYNLQQSSRTCPKLQQPPGRVQSPATPGWILNSGDPKDKS